MKKALEVAIAVLAFPLILTVLVLFAITLWLTTDSEGIPYRYKTRGENDESNS